MSDLFQLTCFTAHKGAASMSLVITKSFQIGSMA